MIPIIELIAIDNSKFNLLMSWKVLKTYPFLNISPAITFNF